MKHKIVPMNPQRATTISFYCSFLLFLLPDMIYTRILRSYVIAVSIIGLYRELSLKHPNQFKAVIYYLLPIIIALVVEISNYEFTMLIFIPLVLYLGIMYSIGKLYHYYSDFSLFFIPFLFTLLYSYSRI